MYYNNLKDDKGNIAVHINIDEKADKPVRIENKASILCLSEKHALELANTIINYYTGNKVQ